MIPNTLTLAVIQSSFDSDYFYRGQQYHADNRVELIDIHQKNNHFWLIEAEVKGSRRYAYDVDVHIKQKGDQFTLNGKCACPMRVNCKHVVAVLLKAMAQGGKMVQEVDFNTMRQLFRYRNHAANASTKLDAWLNNMSHAQEKSPIKHDKSYQLFFELSQSSSKYASRLYCKPALFKILKSGGRSKAVKRDLFGEYNEVYFSQDEKYLLGRMLAEHQWEGHVSTHLENVIFKRASSESLLVDILKTGRCFWSGSGDYLRLGDSITLSFHWVTLPDGAQTLKHNHPSVLQLFLLDYLWYFKADTQEIGRVNTDVPSSFMPYLSNAPSIPPEKSAAARRALEKVVVKDLLPVAYQVKKTMPSSVVSPHLYLTSETIRVYNHQSLSQVKHPVATVRFRYGHARVSWEDTRNTVHSLEGETIVTYKRNFIAEDAALRQMMEVCGLIPVVSETAIFNSDIESHSFVLEFDRDPETLTLDALPVLRRSGWEVEIDKNYPWNVMEMFADEAWYADLQEEGSGMDWFGFALGILLPTGEKVNLLPILQRYLANPLVGMPKTKNMVVSLDGGRKIALPTERIQNAANMLIDIFNRTTGPVDVLRLSRFEAMRLAELQKTLNTVTLRWHGNQKILDIANHLLKTDTLPLVSTSTMFHGQLRAYQQAGLSWLQFLREHQLGGVLADDMGLGKTIQAIAHISVEKQAGRLDAPVLVVAPTSLMFNWQAEIQRFSPDLRVLLLHGAQRREHYDKINNYDVVLTTYPLLARDKDVLLKHVFYLLILDEAQSIKNARSQAAHLVMQLQAKHRLCMTGTPMENHLGELWSLFHFMMPGFFGTEKQFKLLFRVPIEKNQDEDRRKHLARLVSPFLLRRKKSDVVKELPDKTVMVQTIALDTEQRDFYETIRLSMQKKLRESIKKMGFARSQIMILDALLKLRQICCDPRLLKDDKKAKTLSSAKLASLMSMLPELVEEGRRILLFSQFTGMLSLIEKELNRIQMPYVILTGKTRDRQKPVGAFQSGKVPVFLISLKAGGTGLNLTAADTVIHYDPWWNPAVESQATDRAHRVGQDKKVFVYRLVTQGTVEEKIIELQQRKQALVEGLFSNDAKGGSRFSMDDLQILFGSVE